MKKIKSIDDLRKKAKELAKANAAEEAAEVEMPPKKVAKAPISKIPKKVPAK